MLGALTRFQLTPRLRTWLRQLRYYLPPLNFITVHYIYFIGICLLSSVIVWGSSTPARSVSYTNALFLTVSAMTLAGLNTINLSVLNVFQQFVLFLLILLGSAILVSAAVLFIRKRAFEVKFRRIIEEERRKRRERNPQRRSLSISHAWNRPAGETSAHGIGPAPPDQTADGTVREKEETNGPSVSEPSDTAVARAPLETSGDCRVDLLPDTPQSTEAQHVAFRPGMHFRSTSALTQSQQRHTGLFSMQGVGAYAEAANPHQAHGAEHSTSVEKGDTSQVRSRFDTHHFTHDMVGRNSQFHNLTPAEREELGGVEYRAIQVLAIIVPLYYFLWLLLGCLGLGAYIAKNQASVTLLDGLNPWWVGAFNAVSAFNNSGMSLLDSNMIPFRQSRYMLITMGLMILAGNTCYPIFLRLIIWTLLHLIPSWEEELQFLLDHPRRCYTNLFPSAHTKWLLFSVIILNSTDWIAFEVLNIGNSAVTSIPGGSRILDGLFQAIAVRSGGFYIIPISSLRIGLQILYVIMMYISVYPVVITMRNSNVYEERSLGLYADDLVDSSQSSATRDPSTSFLAGIRHRLQSASSRVTNPSYFASQQLRAQLAHDLWWIVLAVLFIAIIETTQFERDPVTYSVFNVIFEVVSGYGCVGLSTGLPNEAYSFSGGWHTLSKLILCVVMLRGRHRGLPVAIDRAVLLPGEYLAEAEEEDAQIRLDRAWSRGGHAAV